MVGREDESLGSQSWDLGRRTTNRWLYGDYS